MSRVAEKLSVEYGKQEYWLRDPVDILIATVLSQNTTDVNSQRSFLRLQSGLQNWEQLADCDPDQVQGLIADSGLGRTRSRRLCEIARQIRADFGKVSLDEFRGWTSQQVMEYLTSLPGVGPKTAACVALFGFNMPVFPVDVHVARLAGRLGLIEDSSTANQQQALAQIVPPDKILDVHLQLIAHGRTICRPLCPRCDQCVLRLECGYRPSPEAVGRS